MNYFAHGRRFLSDPYFLAGTAVPDWLNVVNRRIRARANAARKFCGSSAGPRAAVAAGIVQHHHDDDWFHQTRAFAELSYAFTVAIRDTLAPDDTFRPSFLGHVLVELLLDASLIEHDLGQLDAYYAAMSEIAPEEVAAAVGEITGQEIDLLAQFIPRFAAERFLYDYLDDAKLLWRLNQVMRRLQLPALPAEVAEFFPEARQRVRDRGHELLCQP